MVLVAAPPAGQSPREHTRPTPNRSTAVSATQASELTLTLTDVAVRPVQIWVRTAGALDASRGTVSAVVEGPDAARIRVGQRVRAFPPESRSSMYQARVVRVDRERDRARVVAELAGPARAGARWYVLEIVTEDGEHLSVPNEAIIEAGGRRIVYVAEGEGRYAPREIEVGLQGELYTAVRRGLTAGERVVTFGSFFIDAEHKLKGS